MCHVHLPGSVPRVSNTAERQAVRLSGCPSTRPATGSFPRHRHHLIVPGFDVVLRHLAEIKKKRTCGASIVTCMINRMMDACW
jgi:hypothetical protein